MAEKRSYQRELSARASDNLPFVDEKVVAQVVCLVLRERNKGSKRIVYPYNLSGDEANLIKGHFERHHGKLARRMTIFPGAIRLSDGMGTLIEIR